MYDKVGFPEGKYAPFRKCPKGGGTAMKTQVYGCGLEAALAVVGGKWKPIVLWQLAPGPRRFGELRRLVTGISEKMLIQQLREMEGDGIVARKDYREIPPRVEYSLTDFGVSLAGALRPLCDWGREHMSRIEKAKAEIG
jgi:DNA-binding HxlR family transcriptional regulator